MNKEKLIIAIDQFEKCGEHLINIVNNVVGSESELDLENIDKILNLSIKAYANAVNLRSGLTQMELNELQLNIQKSNIKKA